VYISVFECYKTKIPVHFIRFYKKEVFNRKVMQYFFIIFGKNAFIVLHILLYSVAVL